MSKEHGVVIPAKIRNFTREIRALGLYDKGILTKEDVSYMNQHEANNSTKISSDSTETSSFNLTFFENPNPQLAEFIFPEKPDPKPLPSLESLKLNSPF